MAASQHIDIVHSIILESANVLAGHLPNAFAKAQQDTRIEKDLDRHHSHSKSISSDSTSSHRSSSFSSSYSQSLRQLVNFRRKLIEDERLSQLYKLRYNFTERFDNFAYVHPHGTSNFDYKSIPERKKEGFERFKNKVRKENYRYLRDHPEIRALITLASKKLLNSQPPNPVQYLAEYFVSRLADKVKFKENLQKEIKKVSDYRLEKMIAQGKARFRSGEEVEDEPIPEPEPRKTAIPPPEPVKKKKCKICPTYCVCIKGKGVRRPEYESKTSNQKKMESDAIENLSFKEEEDRINIEEHEQEGENEETEEELEEKDGAERTVQEILEHLYISGEEEENE